MSKTEQRLKSPIADSRQPNTPRRDFLRGSIAAATGAALTASAGTAAAIMTETVSSVKQPDKQEGYRLSKHIADYYKSAAI